MNCPLNPWLLYGMLGVFKQPWVAGENERDTVIGVVSLIVFLQQLHGREPEIRENIVVDG